MPSKLLFKGDKGRKSGQGRGDRVKNDVVAFNVVKVAPTAAHEPEEGWVDAEKLSDLVGPCFVVQCKGHRVYALSLDTSRQARHGDSEAVPTLSCASVLSPPMIALDDGEVYESNPGNGTHGDLTGKPSMLMDLAEPEKAEQVWRLTRLPAPGLHLKGDVPLSDKFTLKSSFERFLACSPYGEIDASREARSALEEWKLELHQRDDGKGSSELSWSLQSTHGTYLSLQSLPDTQAKVAVRGDSKSIGPEELFTIKVQAQNRIAARRANAPPPEEPTRGVKRDTDEPDDSSSKQLKRDKYCW